MEPTQPEFPARTSDDVTLKDGTVVYVRTLNAMLRDDVVRSANWEAQRTCQKLRPGGPDHAAMRSDFELQSPAQQANYLATHEYWMGNLQKAAMEKYPIAECPERGDLTEAQFTDAVEAWKVKSDELLKLREAHEQKLFDEHTKRQLSIQVKTRINRCLEAFFVREFATSYARAFMLWTLVKVCRKEEDHGLLYFRGIQDVIDMDDEDRDALWICYERLDSVKPAEVPTSPDVS